MMDWLTTMHWLHRAILGAIVGAALFVVLPWLVELFAPLHP